MKIIVRCIGKEKDTASLYWCKEYIKRTPWKINFEELPSSQKINVDEIKEEEAKNLLSKVTTTSYLIALDESGVEMRSVEFSDFLTSISKTNKEITFFIGGAYGLSENLKKKCNKLVSLSMMTLPHKMVRMFLSEQLYRAYTISTKHPYHK